MNSKYNRIPCKDFQNFAFIHPPIIDTEWESWNSNPNAWADEVELIEGIDDDPWAMARTTRLEPRVEMVCMCEDRGEEHEGVFYFLEHDCKPEPSVGYGWKFELIKVY